VTSAAALKATQLNINDANYHQSWCVDNHNVGHHLHPSLFSKPNTFITAALPSAVQKNNSEETTGIAADNTGMVSVSVL